MKEAIETQQKCSHHIADGCYKYAIYLTKNKRVNADLHTAQLWFKLACEMGSRVACEDLKEGKKVQKDLKSECDNGVTSACNSYAWGMLYIEKDQDESRKYLEKGCDLGDDKQCEQIERLLKLGKRGR